jgi:hypothetical protein
MNEFENRETKRHRLLSDLFVVYEGATEEIAIDLPDLSTRGMFIPTQRDFPIGSVLKIRFRLPRSNFQISVRAEVRHRIPGSGVGVEFLELSPEAMEAIGNELGGE